MRLGKQRHAHGCAFKFDEHSPCATRGFSVRLSKILHEDTLFTPQICVVVSADSISAPLLLKKGCAPASSGGGES